MALGITIKIIDINPAEDSFTIEAGNFGFLCSIQEFKGMVKSIRHEDIDIRHLLRNLAIKVALSGVDITKWADIKTLLEGSTFQI
ncbi:MAG: hypothetical protein HY886_04930 [Deltaproteobacteria bacterium]|nr:hypothetical protein [Deltaproteobacteria bacterium]